MSLQLRTTTLTAAETDAGIRIYTKDVDGYARELCNNTTASALTSAVKAGKKDDMSQSKGWFIGDLSFQCGIDSALCSFAWASWSQSVFYQDTRDTIRERRHLNTWEETDFVQQGAMRGTNIAAVHSAGAARIVLFFQDQDGYICSRVAKNMTWNKDIVRIVKAAPGSGIGATAWNELDEIRLYYQDEQNVVRSTAAILTENAEFAKKYSHPVGDITAVSWRVGQATEIRLYLQNEINRIVEWCYGGQHWYQGKFEVEALPNADIIAFTRPFDNGARYALHVIWTGQDQQLWQRVIVPGQDWLPPTAISSIRNAGDYAGEWIGDQFTDAYAGIEKKQIKKVRVRCGDIIDAVQLEFDDGSSTDLHGGNTGSEQVFVLNPGADIVRVLCVSDREWIHRLRFETSDNKQSAWYGKELLDSGSSWYSKEYSTHVWSNEGRALAGFLGCTEKYVKGIKPIWSNRYSSASFKKVDDYVKEAARLDGELVALKGRLASTKQRAMTYKESLEGLKGLGAEAMGGLTALAESVEYLHDLAMTKAKARLGSTNRREEDVEKQKKTCQVESDVLEGHFEKLEQALAKIKPVGDKIHSDIAGILTEATSKAETIKSFAKWSDVSHQYLLREKAANEGDRNKWKATAEEAEGALAKKRLARDDQLSQPRPNLSPFEDSTPDMSSVFLASAEDEVKRAEDARNKIVGLLRICEANLAMTEQKMVKIDGVLGNIVAFAKEVQDESTEINVLVGESVALQTMADKYLALLKLIYDSSKPLDASTQAKGFAAGLLPIIQLATSASYLKDLLKIDALQLETTMKDIAECEY